MLALRVILVLSLVVPSAHARDIHCPALYAAVASVARPTWKYAGRPAWKYVAAPALKTFFYPLVAGYHLAVKGEPLAERLRRDSGYLGVFGSLLGVGIFANPFIDDDTYRRATREFDETDPEGLTVFVNMDTPGDDFFDSDKRYFEEHYRKPGKNAVYVTARNEQELFAELKRVRHEKGPIHKMEMVGHGNPGSFSGWKGSLTADSLRKVRANDSLLADLFAPDGHIRIFACYSARGRAGREFIEELGYTLLPRGGTVYASRKLVEDYGSVESLSGIPASFPRAGNQLLTNTTAYGGVKALVGWNSGPGGTTTEKVDAIFHPVAIVQFPKTR